MFYVHYIPINLGLCDESCALSAVVVAGTNLQSLRSRDYYQACQCVPEASFNLGTLTL